MKVKCIIEYNDLQLRRLVKAGEELEVSEARAEVLINAKVCEAIVEDITTEAAIDEDITTEAAIEEAAEVDSNPKKTRKKKVED